MPKPEPENTFDWLDRPVVGGERVLPAGNITAPEHLYAAPEVARAVRAALWRLQGCQPRPENPLKGLIQPGDRVVLKPNLIRESDLRGSGWQHVITHPTVIAAVLDLTAEIMQAQGTITIADGPQTDASFDALCARTGLRELAASATARHGVQVTVVDLRQEEWTTVDGVVVRRRPLMGDSCGYVDMDLQDMSEFVGHAGEGRYYGAAFDTAETNRQHRGSQHRYRISATVMACDVLINMPKLKTHKKAGITGSLKNLVGVNGNKNWLPHYTLDATRPGGDQYPSSTASRRLETSLLRGGKALLSRHPALARPLLPLKRLGRSLFGDTSAAVRSGNWYGNDTLWRMVLDLNRVVLWHDIHCRFLQRPRRYLTIVDGIVMGQGRGPEDPDPVAAGWVLAGANPVAADAVAAVLMGFDWSAIPCIRQALSRRQPPLAAFGPDAIRLNTSSGAHGLDSIPEDHCLRLRPHFGWCGHIESAHAARAS